MGRKLVANVAMRNPETGLVVTFAAGSPVPDWAAERLGDHVLEAATTVDPGSAESRPERPPTAGKGSGLDAWLAYAKAIGVEVPEGATRSEVIASVEGHRLLTKDGADVPTP